MSNVYTNKGEEKTVDLIDANQTFYIGWGTGVTDADKLDTTLETPRAEARVAATKSQPAADTLRLVGTLTAAGSAAAITEVGIFDALTNGNLWIRNVFSVVNLEVGDSIEFTINLQFT